MILFIEKGGMSMFEHYLKIVEKGLSIFADRVSEKDFLYIVGGLFLFGLVAKWIAVSCYNRLMRQAYDMRYPKSTALRKIKNKYEGLVEVNGYVSNPMTLIHSNLNKCTFLAIKLGKWDSLASFCAMAIVAFSGFMGFELVGTKNTHDLALAYVISGCVAGLILDKITSSVRLQDKKMEVAYAIVENLAEVVEVNIKSRYKETINTNEEEKISLKEQPAEKEESINEGAIVNQVIEEYLQ